MSHSKAVNGSNSLMKADNALLLICLIIDILFENGNNICFNIIDFLIIILASTTVAGALVYFVYFQSFIMEDLYRILFKVVVAESIVAVLSFIAYFLEKFFRLILFLGALILIGFIIYYLIEYNIRYKRVSHGLEVVGPSSYFKATSSLISIFLIIYAILNYNEYFLCLSILLLGTYIVISSFKPRIIINFYYFFIWITPVMFLYIFYRILLGETGGSLLLFIPSLLSISVLSRTFYYTTYHYSFLKTLIRRPIIIVDVRKFRPHIMYNILSMVLSGFRDYNKVVFISGYTPIFMPIVLDVMSKIGFSNKIDIFVTRVQAGPIYKFMFKKYVIKKFKINETILPHDRSQIFKSINFLVRTEKKTLVFIDDLVELANILGTELVYNIIKSILQKSDHGEKVALIVFVRLELMDLFKKDINKLYNEIKSFATTVLKV